MGWMGRTGSVTADIHNEVKVVLLSSISIIYIYTQYNAVKICIAEWTEATKVKVSVDVILFHWPIEKTIVIII